MGSSLAAAKEWLTENQDEVILCPHQPGRLMISRTACVKRHWAAEREKDPDLIHEKNIFMYRWKKGLLLCRECYIGRALNSVLPGESPHAEGASLS